MDINTAYNDNIPLPESTIGYKTNPIYKGFPPMMSDGRALIASYQPESVLNNKMIHENNITTNWQYRNYLTKNANEIRDLNMRETCNDSGYYKRYADMPSSDNSFAASTVSQNTTPYLYTSYNDNTQVNAVNKTSNLKEMYLSREQLNSRKFIPTIYN